MEETKIVELIVRKSRQMYPKGQQFNIEGEYAIISFYVIDEIEGKVHKDKVWDTIMVKGVMPEIKAGEDYHLIAVETYDERYKNYSYDVSYIGERISVMEDIEDIRMVLEESTSVSLASRIVELPNVKEILDNRDVEALKQVKGIGDKLCVKIMDNYHEKLKSGIYLIKLTRLGLNSTMIESLVEKYSNYEVIYNKIKENPYMLADDVKGIGFMKADALAEMFGIAQNSTFRIEAYVSHILKEEANAGKSFVFTKDVLNTIRSNTKKEYPIEKEVLTETFERMKKHNKLWWNDNKSVLASPYVRDTELEIANHLIRIMGAKITPDLSTMEETIRAIEKRKGFEYTSEQKEGVKTVLTNKKRKGFKYTSEQREGIKTVLTNPLVVVTGLAGTGKTTVLEPMTNIFVDQQGQTLIQCALAGKATQRIKEVTGYFAETIHSTLDYNPKNKTKENPTPFGYNEDKPLKADIIICDEFSMVDASLTLALLKAIPTGARLYLVGDYGQLQCIGFGDVLLDLINSGIIPVVKLTQIHRQAQASAIITESIKVRNQQHIIEAEEEGYKILGELQDLEIDVTKDREVLQDKVIKYFKEGLERENNNIMEVQVVCATRVRGDLSTFEINNIIKELVNPLKEDELFAECVVDKGHRYRISVNDKVIVTKNNRKALVWSEDVQDYVQGMICNGNMGIVKEIGTNNMVVDIDGVGTVLVEKKNFNDIELAYAVTCHKCVVGDTLILTDKGLKTIKEVVENKNSVVYNGEKLEKPSNYIKIGKEETFKVVTTRGYNITGTDDHKVDFIDRDGNIGVKTIGELESGDALILRLNSDIYGDNISFPDSCYDTYNIRHNIIKYKDYPKILNNELSELLGMIVADGTIDRKRLKFSKKYLEVSERFSYLIKKYFGYEVSPKLRPSGDYMCEVNSTYISNFFMGIDGLKPHKKDIPNIIMETNKENQYAFLRGLFEDGTVNIKKGKFDHIELAMGTGTKTMLKKIQQMLLNMGIVCTLREYKINDKEKNVIYIYKDFANVFFDKIGFMSAFKQERLKKCLIKEKRNSDRKSIPFINNLMREVVTDNTDIKLLDKSLKNILFSSSEKATKNITLTMLKRFLNIYGNIEDERVEYLKRFLKDFYVDTVEKIETNGLEEVYCVTMPKTHKFTQNGFMAWNCQGSQANYVVVAVDSSAWMMLCCEWLYTAVTRAKKHCALVGETKAVRRCCYNLMGNHKLTFLPSFFKDIKERIKNLKEIVDKK